MKIQELLEDGLLPPSTTVTTGTFTNVGLSNTDDAVQQYQAQDWGIYSMGKPDPEDPHLYYKKGIVPTESETDPMYLYHQAIENIKGDNPWLPVVYSTEITKDPRSSYYHLPSYKMEKLYRIDTITNTMGNYDEQDLTKKNSLPKKLTYSSIENIIDQEPSDSTIERSMAKLLELKRTHKYSDPYSVDFISNIYMKILRHIIERGISNPEIVNDPNLKQACEIIRNILKKSDRFALDLHRGNILFRKTSVGIQPVIVDPIA